MQVDIVYDVRGLTVLHDGWSAWSLTSETLGHSSEHIHVPDWNPQRGWQFAFGASASPRWADYHYIDNLVIWSNYLVLGPVPYDLQVHWPFSLPRRPSPSMRARAHA